MRRGERSHWHRIDIAELWHFYAGAPLLLRRYDGSGPTQSVRLGTDLVAGERPQALIPTGHWQSAESLGDWTLVGCTVAPGFRFEGWELASPDWRPETSNVRRVPEPIISISLEPKSTSDREKLATVVARLAIDDPTLRVRVDAESGQTIIAGTSELHLDAVVGRLEQEFPIELNLGPPEVAYYETITRPGEIDYTHKKQTGGLGQFARVKMRFEPLPSGSGFNFESMVAGGNVPDEYVPHVEKGVRSVLNSGPLAGFPIVDIKVTLLDGAHHETDSSALTFEIAGRVAFREGVIQGRPAVLEPMMWVEITTPDQFRLNVIGDLKSRRAEGLRSNAGDDATIVGALVPFANMFGYWNNLRTMSQGQAEYTMTFSHYAPIPSHPDDDLFPPAVGMRA